MNLMFHVCLQESNFSQGPCAVPSDTPQDPTRHAWQSETQTSDLC